MRTSAHRTEAQAGFTLMEVLMALVVLSVLSTLLSLGLRGSLRVHELQRAEPEVLEARRVELARQLSGDLEEPVVSLEEIVEDGG